MILKRFENAAKPGTKKKISKAKKWVAASVAAAVLITGITIGVVKAVNSKNSITITGKSFTEQEILVNIYKELIENRTDLKVDKQSFISGSAAVFQGLKKGDYDISVEYTGTGLMNYLKEDIDSTDPDKVYNYVKKRFKEKYNLIWLDPIGFNNTYSLTIRKEDAKKWNVKTISDLAEKAPELILASEPEFLERDDGYPGLKKAYGIEFGKTQAMDSGIIYSAAKNHKADVIDAYTTDGRIPAFNLQVLEDDKHVFPPYNAVPLVRGEVLKEHPELKKVLNLLAGKISDKKMQELNAEVDIHKKTYKEVAHQFLMDEGLLKK
nr:glycine betaine ABC transporter substrate-binding protein [Heyndrickxia shackletonii]